MLGFALLKLTGYSLEVPLSIYRFEKVCFPFGQVPIADQIKFPPKLAVNLSRENAWLPVNRESYFKI